MSTRTILRHEYTVAWICAFGHNIVIACLPSGVYGTNSATSSVAHLKRTFPSIRFGLMVGVGGGVPFNGADVRLGDVVVSMPTEKYGGVFQYDQGKMCHGHLEPTGCLNKPSPLLLTVLSKMRASYVLPESKPKRIVADSLQRHQAIGHFSRPHNDWLFHAMYEHHRGNPNCLSCDKEKLVLREPRATDEPHIHYGLIASGNQVMKDAQTRDSIAKDLPALCFEMEAAGIMDQLSCLVIRGICDYCDSHKQKNWQGYAALAASAYTKALLSLVPLVQGTVSEEGFEFTERKGSLAILLNTDPEQHISSWKRRKVNRTPGTCSWFLESTELTSWFRRDHDIDSLEQNVLWLYGNPGIGKSTMAMTLVEELPKKDYFTDGHNILSFFFCEASHEHQRGATSILRGLICQILNQYPPFMRSVMSRYEVRCDDLTSFDTLWAVLMDVGRAVEGPEIYCIVDALDECAADSQDMLLQQIYHSFSEERVSSSAPHKLHMLIISRPYPDHESCLSIFRCIDLGSCEGVERDLEDMIQDTVKKLARRNRYTETVSREVSRILKDKAEGTFLWVGIVYDELKSVRSWKVIERLHAYPRGLHSLYKNLLDAAVKSTTVDSPDDYPLIRRILEFVAFAIRPLTLMEIAEACQLYLDKDLDTRLQFTRDIIGLCHLLIVVDKDHVRMLHGSVQDFLQMEMQDINPKVSNYALSHRCIEVVLQYCWPGMDRSTLDSSQGFLGYSVLHWPEHANLAGTEFTVSREIEQFCRNRRGTWKRWLDSHDYMKRCSGGDPVTGLSATHVAARWGIIPLILCFQDELEEEDLDGETPLLTAARHSQLDVIKILVDSGAYVDALNNDHQNALHITCKNSHDKACKLADFLLDSGVSSYEHDKDNMTPFLYAIGNSHIELAQVFLRHGFEVRQSFQRQWWPERRLVNTITHSLHDQQVVARDNGDSGLTALHFSALNACSKMTAFLLRHGADPNARSDFSDTPLHLAIRRRLIGRNYDDVWENGGYVNECFKIFINHESEEAFDIYRLVDNTGVDIVETLLESETIDVDLANSAGDCPQHVIDFGKDYAWPILRKLIEKGADSSRLNGSHQTCLHLASKRGNLEVVRNLVADGHDILLNDIDGLNPFHYALDHGCLGVVQFMSEARDSELSDVWDSLDNHGRTPLHHHVSSVFCYTDMVDFLIQRGCNINTPDGKGNSSLHLYVDSFHLKVDKEMFFFFIRKGADPLWVNERQENLAHLLMHHRGADHELLKFLFDSGLDPAARDTDGKCFIHHGAIYGVFTKELVEFLHSRGALDMQSRDSAGKTPLDYAEEKTHQGFSDFELLHSAWKWRESFDNLSAVTSMLL
ncbi:Pfs, NACHT, and Ankyrin domain protein [Aspergillus candidus]|uniref:Ankyrin repeat-containing domain protein n=1 Tax=Aspergillus candidus TaxID=41067 RepID=A0A2I2FNB9_ASPCN|nr:ankyrin repeat-containing domain protein [Aspergillus candidus]PLB42131.1 ankyrin repeat-containing domain protein [Aspergillus candidus]